MFADPVAGPGAVGSEVFAGPFCAQTVEIAPHVHLQARTPEALVEAFRQGMQQFPETCTRRHHRR